MNTLPKTFRPVFSQQYSVSIPENDRPNFFRWQNREWVGKETIPLSKKVPKELQDAAWSLCASRRMLISYVVSRDGEPTPTIMIFGGKTYKLAEDKIS